MLSRFVIAFIPRSKHLLASWLQSPSYKFSLFFFFGCFIFLFECHLDKLRIRYLLIIKVGILFRQRSIGIRLGFPCGSDGKESVYNTRDLGSVPGL